MSIVRLYRDRTTQDGTRQFEYREAWIEPDGGPFVVHQGRVGAVGTVGEQPLRSEEEGVELLAAFAETGREEGFAEADEDAFAVLSVTYRLRGLTATGIERTHGETLRAELTHQLAWRGLGEVTDVTEDEGRLILTVRTPHASKAAAEVSVAAKRAHGIQPNKVEVVAGDMRTPDVRAAADDAGSGPVVATDREA